MSSKLTQGQNLRVTQPSVIFLMYMWVSVCVRGVMRGVFVVLAVHWKNETILLNVSEFTNFLKLSCVLSSLLKRKHLVFLVEITCSSFTVH